MDLALKILGGVLVVMCVYSLMLMIKRNRRK